MNSRRSASSFYRSLTVTSLGGASLAISLWIIFSPTRQQAIQTHAAARHGRSPVRRTTPVTYPTSHGFEYGCSGSIGETWYDDPSMGIYTTNLDYLKVRFKVTKVDIYDQYNQKTTGSIYDVDFDDMRAWPQGEDWKRGLPGLPYIKEILETLFGLLIGMIFEGIFEYGDNSTSTTLPDANQQFTKSFFEYGDMAGIKGEIDYDGDMPEGGHVIVTVEVKTTGYFEVYREDYPKLGGTLLYQGTLIYQGNIANTDTFTLRWDA